MATTTLNQESAILAWRLVLPKVADLHDGTLRSLLRAYPTLLELCPDALSYIYCLQPPPRIVAHVYDALPSLPYDAASYCRDAAHTRVTIDAFNTYVFALQCTKGCGGTWRANCLAIYRHPEPLTIKLKQPNGLSVIMMMYKLPLELDIKYITEMVCGERLVAPPIIFVRKLASCSASSYSSMSLVRHRSSDAEHEQRQQQYVAAAALSWPAETQTAIDDDDNDDGINDVNLDIR